MAGAGVAGPNCSCNGGTATLQLATVAPALATTSHDPSKPDLFGQAYRRLFDAAFHAIIEGRTVVATTLFPIVIDVAEKARLRLTSDLSDERSREQAIFGTEPFVDMMESSGYALLMAHVEPPGTQALVRAAWDAIFVSTTMPDLAGALLGVLVLQENNFAITSGGVNRTGRQMELARLLRDRGVVSDFGAWPHPPQPTHDDPVVAVFAPDDMMGVHHDLADLFVVSTWLTARKVLAISYQGAGPCFEDPLIIGLGDGEELISLGAGTMRRPEEPVRSSRKSYTFYPADSPRAGPADGGETVSSKGFILPFFIRTLITSCRIDWGGMIAAKRGWSVKTPSVRQN